MGIAVVNALCAARVVCGSGHARLELQWGETHLCRLSGRPVPCGLKDLIVWKWQWCRRRMFYRRSWGTGENHRMSRLGQLLPRVERKAGGWHGRPCWCLRWLPRLACWKVIEWGGWRCNGRLRRGSAHLHRSQEWSLARRSWDHSIVPVIELGTPFLFRHYFWEGAKVSKLVTGRLFAGNSLICRGKVTAMLAIFA